KRHEPTCLHPPPTFIDRDDPVLGRELDDLLSMQKRKGCRDDEESLIAVRRHALESCGEFLRSMHGDGMNVHAQAPSRRSHLLVVQSEHPCYDIFPKDRES